MTAPGFDGMAEDYDATFTDTRVGQWMRTAVWQRCDTLFAPGTRVLELNCGTGADAVYLAGRGVRVTATDASAAMVAVAARKVEAAGLASMVSLAQRRIEDIEPAIGVHDGLLSNFGGLNCVPDLHAVARRLATVVRHGGRALVCVMGPWVPWEWLWFLAHRDPRRATRRLGRGGVQWRGHTIRYHTAGHVRRAFAPSFRTTRVWALGAIMPPPFAEAWVARHPTLAHRAVRLERAVDTVWPLPWLADHVVLEMERVA